MPSTAQIKLYVPKHILECKDAPRSPGRGATEQQRAKYLLGLYDAWETCNGNLASVRTLYNKYRDNLKKVAEGKVKTNFNK